MGIMYWRGFLKRWWNFKFFNFQTPSRVSISILKNAGTGIPNNLRSHSMWSYKYKCASFSKFRNYLSCRVCCICCLDIGWIFFYLPCIKLNGKMVLIGINCLKWIRSWEIVEKICQSLWTLDGRERRGI